MQHLKSTKGSAIRIEKGSEKNASSEKKMTTPPTTKHHQSRQRRHAEKETAKNHSKCIMVVERDIVRKLIIPRDKNRKLTTLLSESQFNRIKKNSRLFTDSPIPEEEEEEPTTEKLIEEEQAKIDKLTKQIENLKKDTVNEQEEEEQRREKELVLARAEQLKQEQEDEMKQYNSLLLSIKCKAIQDAQVAEKELIKQRLKFYDDTEDAKMEEDRKLAEEALRKKREEEYARKQQYAQCILEQIEQNEKKRYREMQMIKKESKLMKMKSKQLKDEEIQTCEKKASLNLELKKQNQLFNEQIKRNKEQQREQEKLESLKIQEYLRTKIQQEREYEKQHKTKSQLQQRELARLWNLQKTSQSLAQTKDEIIADRIQEEIQRKWRQKEIETVKKKLQQNEELRDVRQRQISEKRTYQTVEAKQKEEEAKKINNENSKLQQELELLKIRHKEMIEKHKAALLEQITEKERRKKCQREEKLQEGRELQNRVQNRDKLIKQAIEKKIDQIRYTRNVRKNARKTYENCLRQKLPTKQLTSMKGECTSEDSNPLSANDNE